MKTTTRFVVFAVRKRGMNGAIWTRAGVAAVNADGSINVDLDVLPLEGRLHLRPADQQHRVVWVEALENGQAAVVGSNDPTGQSAEIIGSLPDGWTIDQAFNAAANAALEQRAELSSEWLRKRGAPDKVPEPAKEGE